MTFTDKNLQHRIGLIVRVNQHPSRPTAMASSGVTASICFVTSSRSDPRGRERRVFVGLYAAWGPGHDKTPKGLA